MGRARREIEYRLVDDKELVPLERGLDIADDARVDTAAKHHRLVARVPLRRIHLAVRASEEVFRRRAVVGIHGPSDASVDLHGRALDAERSPERVPQPSDERAGPIVASRAHGEDDVVAADASDGVCFANDCLGPQATRKRLQYDVAGPMSADVVDVLEAVEIDDDEREWLA